MQVVDDPAKPAAEDEEQQRQRLWDQLVTTMQVTKGLSALMLQS